MIKVFTLLNLYQSLSENNLKHYIPLFLNMKKEETHLLFVGVQH